MADYGKVSIDEASMASNKTGRDLLVDQDRQYTEDEKRVAIMVQAAYRGSNQRKDFSKLQAQGLSADAVEFQRAVKTANGVKTDVTVLEPEVEMDVQGPVGALLAMYTFHKVYQQKSLGNLWGLWKCFISNALIDLPLGILAHFFLLCFTGAAFYTPMWASITVRFIFYDGQGQIEVEQFLKWLLVFAICTTALWCMAAILFSMLQERFGNRVKKQITLVSSEYAKLISKAEVDRFRGMDLASTKRIFFEYAPRGLAAFLVVIAGLNFLFIRSAKLGLVTLGCIAFSAIYMAIYDHFVSSHNEAVEDVVATEKEFWSYLQSRDRDVAVAEIMALAKEESRYSMRQMFYHLAMGSVHRAALLLSIVLIVFVGSMQITSGEIRQYELLFCFFYYLFTMFCVYWLNTACVGIVRDLGAAFRLSAFLNSTKSCAAAAVDVDDVIPEEQLEGIRKLAAKTKRPPFGVILVSFLLFGGAIAAFVSVAAAGKTTIGCKPAEMVCNVCGQASHTIDMPQYFDR
jgi:hypothetical protein